MSYSDLQNGDVGNTGIGVLSGWRWLSRLFGAYMFEGARDLYKAFGYNRAPRTESFLFKYLRQDIAKRIIDAPVRATWGDPPVIDADPEFLAAWQNLLARQRVWHKIMSLDKLVGLGAYGIMVIGFDDGGKLDSPLTAPSPNKPRNVLYLQPYMQRSCRIISVDTNPNSARFGLPTMYRIDPRKLDIAQSMADTSAQIISPTASQQAFNVHFSRVLHVADNTLENDVFGSSRLECVYNLLDDLLKVVGGSAETFWMTANRGLQVDVDKEMNLEKDDAANLQAEMDEFQHNLRRIVRTRGVKINNIGSDMADPSANVKAIISLISAACGIPQRVLLGSELGELASQQDRANWAVRVSERQEDYAEPVILIPLILMLVAAGVLPVPKSLKITWPEAFKLSPLERAQTSAQMARSAANLQKMLSDPIGGVQVEESVVETIPDVGIDSTQESVVINAAKAKATAQPGSSATADPTTVEGTPAKPSKVITTKRSWIEGGKPMFTFEESRGIVGFGKTMPVFDDPQDASSSPKVSQLSETKTVEYTQAPQLPASQ